MTPAFNTHLELLTEQVSCLFRYVNDKRLHRTKFNSFNPLVIDGHQVIIYQHQNLENGRSVSRVLIDTENRLVSFCQHYNFGVLLNVEIRLSTEADRANPQYTISEYINRYDTDEGSVKEALMDFEYAISMVTDNMAMQLPHIGA